MILLHIVTNNEEQALDIVDFLDEQKLILDAIVLKNAMLIKRNEKGMMQSTKQYLIMGKTKSLLFATIDKKLHDRYPENMPVLYSLPIVNMDWKQADELVKETAKV